MAGRETVCAGETQCEELAVLWSSVVSVLRRAAVSGERGYRQSLHAQARPLVESDLRETTEEHKAETHDRIWDGGALGEGVNAELYLSCVEPLAHFLIHLASFEMSRQRPVVPPP